MVLSHIYGWIVLAVLGHSIVLRNDLKCLMKLKEASWAYWIGPTACASLARVRIGCGEGQAQPGSELGVVRVRHSPVMSRSVVMWQVQGQVMQSAFRVQIKHVHGHTKGKAGAGLESSTLTVLLGQGLMAPGWGESLGNLHVWKYLRPAWKRLRSTLSASENGPPLSRELEETNPAFPPSLG